MSVTVELNDEQWSYLETVHDALLDTAFDKLTATNQIISTVILYESGCGTDIIYLNGKVEDGLWDEDDQGTEVQFFLSEGPHADADFELLGDWISDNLPEELEDCHLEFAIKFLQRLGAALKQKILASDLQTEADFEVYVVQEDEMVVAMDYRDEAIKGKTLSMREYLCTI